MIISDARSSPVEVDHPGLLAPTVSDGRPSGPPLSPVEPYWSDPGVLQGPLSVLVSRADRRAYVYRGGVQIGSAPVAFENPHEKSGVAAFALLEKPDPLQIISDNPALRWTAVQVSNPERGMTPAEQLGKVSMDRQFLRSLLLAMDVGSTLVITDLPSTRETRSNPDFTVITTNSRPMTSESAKNQTAD
ncbi:hypothetical protein D9M73_168090 [compost metagenome]